MDLIIPKTVHHKLSEHGDGSLTIATMQDIEPALKAAEEARNHGPRQDMSGSAMHHIATVPLVVVQAWKDEGFDLMSPERSGMTKEEHKIELARRLNGDWSKLNTSRFRRV